jgi:hypothetical protein
MTPELGNVLPDNISHKHPPYFVGATKTKKDLYH